MSDTSTISFDIETSDAECPLAVEIWLDDAVLLSNNHVQEKITFSHDINDDDGEHELRIVMLGKTSEHTEIDEAGNIIKDATLQISNFVIDDVNVNQIFLKTCTYEHDFNGTQPKIEDSFYGVAGCNGTISFEFSTPIYLWLLENM
jgi:hypothetical protein